MAQRQQNGTSRNKRSAAENALMNRMLLGRTPAFQPSEAAWQRAQTSTGATPAVHPALRAAAGVIRPESGANIAKAVTADPLSRAAERLAQGGSERGEPTEQEDDTTNRGRDNLVCPIPCTRLKRTECGEQSAADRGDGPDPGDEETKGTDRVHKDVSTRVA